MKPVKIGYFADGIWGRNAFKLIHQDESFSIKFLCLRFKTPDSTLKQLAESSGIDVIIEDNVNCPHFIKKVKQYECDIFVSMSFDQIFKKDIIDIPRMGIINCHAGKLPFYRGKTVLSWALINDEKEFGITVHQVDEGIDTGDIILQKTYPISDADDYGTLLSLAQIECAKVLHEALCMICQIGGGGGIVPQTNQKSIHSVGMYCGTRKEGDEIINWNSSSRELFCFVRALAKPAVMAKSFLNGKDFLINKASMVTNAPIYKGIPGQILYKDDGKLIVKTKDSILRLEEYFHDGIVKIGDRLN
ncbi:MAG: hypothetical protein LBJ03_04030 [Holosporales bacterium]|nr:hypothetical protein [Holosporales bacterium]